MTSSSTNGSAPGRPRVLMIDNYDSFTWNLYQYLCGMLGGLPLAHAMH
jgi:hypothetical protein